METDEHFLDLVHGEVEIRMLVGLDVVQVLREQQQVLRLCCRTGGNADEPCTIGTRRSCDFSSYRSSAGNPCVARYTPNVSRCAFCQTFNPRKSRISPSKLANR